MLLHIYALTAVVMLQSIISFKQFPNIKNCAKLASKMVSSLRISPTSTYRLPVVDTIYSVSSGSIAVSGVSVIRISGPQSTYCLDRLINRSTTSPRETHLPKPRYASLKTLW